MSGSRAAGNGLKDPEDDFSFTLLRGDVERLMLDVEAAQAAADSASSAATAAAAGIDAALLKANNLSDLLSATTARANLGVGDGLGVWSSSTPVAFSGSSTPLCTFQFYSPTLGGYDAATGLWTVPATGTYAITFSGFVTWTGAAGAGTRVSIALTPSLSGDAFLVNSDLVYETAAISAFQYVSVAATLRLTAATYVTPAIGCTSTASRFHSSCQLHVVRIG